MSKKLITINVDDEIHNRFKGLVPNVSEALNDYMRSYSGIDHSIDEELLKIKLRHLAPVVGEYNDLKKRLDDLKAEREKALIKKKEQELQEQLNAIKCFYCGNATTEAEQKKNKFSNGVICRSCFTAGVVKIKDDALIK